MTAENVKVAKGGKDLDCEAKERAFFTTKYAKHTKWDLAKAKQPRSGVFSTKDTKVHEGREKATFARPGRVAIMGSEKTYSYRKAIPPGAPRTRAASACWLSARRQTTDDRRQTGFTGLGFSGRSL
ncbi:MAG: hypothetical protein WC712_06275 [Candidatus Brocadiia bacterium]